jgi:Arylsulfotransferase (ASST)
MTQSTDPGDNVSRSRWIGALVLFAAVASAAATAGALSGRDAAQAGPVSAFPAPGTIAAAAGTEISLRGVAPGEIGTVQVSGSRSGAVEGELKPHSDGRGASFVPAERLRAGERISVRTDLAVRGGRAGDFRFTIGRRPAPRQVDDGKLELPPLPPGNFDRFRSDLKLKSPVVRITQAPTRTASGEIFLSPVSIEDSPSPDGPLIVDDRGDTVWFQQADPRGKVFDFKTQTYEGEPILTWWEGRFALGWGYGEYILMDDTYREIRRISAGNGYRGDFHDMIIDRVRRDLRPVGGPRNGVMIDNVIQELDLETGRVLFEWHSLGTVPLRHSRYRPVGRQTFDYFHVNSIEIDHDGDLLISARNTCALYKLDRTSGRLIWTLGGKDSDFKLRKGARFCYQHDARRVSGDVISVFDNVSDKPAKAKPARAITLRVDERRKTVRLLRQYKHPAKLLAPNQGSARVLGNGNVLVGWGAAPVFTEFSEAGRVLFNGRLTTGKGSYRAARAEWTGRPTTAPKVAAQRRGSRVAVWASWNGATEVARWQVLAGDGPDALQPSGGARRDGFETAMSVPRAAYVAVRALDADGAELGTSKAVRPRED